MDELNPKYLTGLAVEKHEKLIKDYREELSKIERVTLLEDKLSQIEHWIRQNPKDREEYSRRKSEASSELESLRGGLEKRARVQDYRRSLTKKIEEHEMALDYWRGSKIG